MNNLMINVDELDKAVNTLTDIESVVQVKPFTQLTLKFPDMKKSQIEQKHANLLRAIGALLAYVKQNCLDVNGVFKVQWWDIRKWTSYLGMLADIIVLIKDVINVLVK